MTLSELLNGTGSEDDEAQAKELKKARAERSASMGELLHTLRECQVDAGLLNTKLAKAVRQAEDLDESSDDIPIHDECCDMDEDCTCGAQTGDNEKK